jgi:Ferritin-like
MHNDTNDVAPGLGPRRAAEPPSGENQARLPAPRAAQPPASENEARLPASRAAEPPSGENQARLPARRANRVRIIDDIGSPHRRDFLRAVAIGGFAAAGGGLILPPSAMAALPADPAVLAPAMTSAAFVRDFGDPYLELVRLLREATEVEHGLMLQYLYGGFSLKPAYAELLGYGAPNTTDFLGVAVQEMQHLGSVNQLLVELGAPPNLTPQDFPYEPDIYPFEFALERLSPHSLAKYVYCEAPVGFLDPANTQSPADRDFAARMKRHLGGDARPNHVGSFYDLVLRTLAEVEAMQRSGVALPNKIDCQAWKAKLIHIKDEGELGHYTFFKEAFLGTHAAFRGRPNPWDLAPSHPDYPSMPVPLNPTAFVGHNGHIADPHALNLAWLGNLHYWTVLAILSHTYSHKSPELIDKARLHMMGPLTSLARHLPTVGAAMPFDRLSMGYGLGTDAASCRFLLTRFLREIVALEKRLEGKLPADYPHAVAADTLAEILNGAPGPKHT